MFVRTIALAALTCMGATSVQAQDAEKIKGTWRTVSVVAEENGNMVEPWGSKPKGVLTLDGNTAVSFVSRGDMKNFASGSRTQGTPEEYKAAVESSLAYFSDYRVNEADKTLEFTIIGATFPNWIGQTQKRNCELKGDDLIVRNPGNSRGTGTTTITYQRFH